MSCVFGNPIRSAVSSAFRYFSAHCCTWNAGDHAGSAPTRRSASAEARSPSAFLIHSRIGFAASASFIEDAAFPVHGIRDRPHRVLEPLELVGADDDDVLRDPHGIERYANLARRLLPRAGVQDD